MLGNGPSVALGRTQAGYSSCGRSSAIYVFHSAAKAGDPAQAGCAVEQVRVYPNAASKHKACGFGKRKVRTRQRIAAQQIVAQACKTFFEKGMGGVDEHSPHYSRALAMAK
jgi:hypothetical protein